MARKRRVCSPLLPAQRQFLGAEIARLIPVACRASDSNARTARFLIDSMLWCWTADGVDPAGEGVRDGIKYDLLHQRHSIAALAQWESTGRRGTGLRHEHAVPRNVLLTHLIGLEAPTSASVAALLGTYCFAVIITKAEDKVLNDRGLRDSMPDGWSFASASDPLQRYVHAELSHSLRGPALRVGA